MQSMHAKIPFFFVAPNFIIQLRDACDLSQYFQSDGFVTCLQSHGSVPKKALILSRSQLQSAHKHKRGPCSFLPSGFRDECVKWLMIRKTAFNFIYGACPWYPVENLAHRARKAKLFIACNHKHSVIFTPARHDAA